MSIMTVTFGLRLGQSPSQEDGEDSGLWRATDRVYGASTVVCDLDPNSLYAFRVRSCRNSMFSPYSPEVTFHTPPAPGRPKLHSYYLSFKAAASFVFFHYSHCVLSHDALLKCCE